MTPVPESRLTLSPPLQGEGWVGMGLAWRRTRIEAKPIPIPTFPLKGKEKGKQQASRLRAEYARDRS